MVEFEEDKRKQLEKYVKKMKFYENKLKRNNNTPEEIYSIQKKYEYYSRAVDRISKELEED